MQRVAGGWQIQALLFGTFSILFFFFFQYVPSRLVVSVDVEPGEVEGGNDLPLPFLGALW